MLRLLSTIIFLLLCFSMASAQERELEPAASEGLKHSVDLAELIIDDFENFSDRFLPFSEAFQEDVLRARNRIRPFCAATSAVCFPPVYEQVSEASAWVYNENLVIGYMSADGTPYAFPVKVLTFHELVSDTLAGEAILVAYNPQSNNVGVYSRVVGDATLDFGNTSIYYQNISTIYDMQSESIWLTTNGRAIVGEMTDSQLTRLPSVTTTWQEWSSLHPDTLVLARRENYVDYDQNIFSGYTTRLNLGRFVFPVSDTILEDTRLQYGDEILLLDTGSEAKAYPFEGLQDNLYMDSLNGQTVLLLGHTVNEQTITAAFSSELEDGSTVEMQFEKIEGGWLETNSQSTLDYSGHFTGGSLDGHYLLPLPTGSMYWFAVVATYPQIAIYPAAAN